MRTALISTLGVMLMLTACAKPPSQTRNACAIFEQRDGLFNNWRRAAIAAERALETHGSLRAIAALAHFFLAWPDHFDRMRKIHRQLDCLADNLDLAWQLAAEPAAQQMVVHAHLFRPDAGCLRRLGVTPNDGAPPQVGLCSSLPFFMYDGLRQLTDGYRFVDAGEGPGEGSIRVGLVYRTSRFQAVGAPATLLEPPFNRASRAPLAQAFRAGRGPVSSSPNRSTSTPQRS